MLIINFEGRKAKGLSEGRYDETFAGEDERTADSGVMPPVFSLSKYPIEYLTLDT